MEPWNTPSIQVSSIQPNNPSLLNLDCLINLGLEAFKNGVPFKNKKRLAKDLAESEEQASKRRKAYIKSVNDRNLSIYHKWPNDRQTMQKTRPVKPAGPQVTTQLKVAVLESSAMIENWMLGTCGGVIRSMAMPLRTQRIPPFVQRHESFESWWWPSARFHKKDRGQTCHPDVSCLNLIRQVFLNMNDARK